MSNPTDVLSNAALVDSQGMPTVVDHVAVARLYGEPLFSMPTDLYIPPDAL
jgi:segregation and condensation protein A